MKVHKFDFFFRKSMPISIRERLFYFMLILIVISGGISISASLYANSIIGRYDMMFQKVIWINNLTMDLDSYQNSVRQYLITGNRDFLDDYGDFTKAVEEDLNNISKSLNNQNSAIIFIKIQNMFNSMAKENLLMINKYQNSQSYLEIYQNVIEINSYINTRIKELMDNELEYNKQIYEILGWRVNLFQNLILGVLIIVIIGGVIFSWRFSNMISNPIHKLADQALRISNGQLEMKNIELEPEEININDEIGRLTIAFNEMIHNIQKLISEIEEKAKLETLLKESELKALQSQVNPHFLFNILGGVVEAALIEGADKTLCMVEDIASLLRYSLTSFYKSVTLNDEIKMVKRYINLQSQRFGSRIRFNFNVPENIPDLDMPCMTIQPFVENAIIHGIENKIVGGVIDISIIETKYALIINISDDGAGIESQMLEKLLAGSDDGQHIGHTTGIGVNNVNQRLKMFYGLKGLVDIKSVKNEGTCVKISLPLDKNKENW